MTMPDDGTPFCSPALFSAGAFADLAALYPEQALADILLEGTRLCEDEAGRRLAPFTVTAESHRAEGMDPDEYTDTANLPLDIQGTLGMSYANAVGASTLVRHIYLNEFADRYTDMWTYSGVTLTIARSYGGTEVLNPTQFTGPDADSGHVWFQQGTFLPIGSIVYASYSAGYTIATPASLVRANKFMSASLIVRELNPEDTSHDPDVLRDEALKIMGNWQRS
jgi:hypothetical protein